MTTTNEITVSQSSNLDLAAPYAAYVVQFNQFRSKTAESIIGMAETVYLAKKNLQNANSKGKEKNLQFEEFCKGIRFNGKSSAIRKFLQIGEMADMLKRHADNLPNTWTTIYTLTQLGKDVLEKMIEEQRVIASITAQEAKALIGKKPKAPQETGEQQTSTAKEKAQPVAEYSLVVHFDKTPSPSLALRLEEEIQRYIKREELMARCLRSSPMDVAIEQYLVDLKVAA
jgi:hypothetical protein